ncbi:MAG: [Lachnospiraceae bacterium]|nr:[FeFe] hydrogenase H-cluster maturation GTPase HydF [Lachnospiraceae bacterium]
MGLNDILSADRVHIGFFGMRNAGKSSVVNAVTGQDLSVVSPIAGTTTDSVKKAMELLPIGPVVIIDTPGLDDEGELGLLRVEAAKKAMAQINLAVLVADATAGLREGDRELLKDFEEKKIPCVLVYNKKDLLENTDSLLSSGNMHKEGSDVPDKEPVASPGVKTVYTSALTGEGIHELKEALGDFARAVPKKENYLVVDLLNPGDVVILVTPIDESAPKGRMILPQQQVMRELLDYHYFFMTCQETELKDAIAKLSVKPKMVITDSQVFEKVAKDTPDDVLLTSFSILMSRYKGGLKAQILGAKKLSEIKDGDKILISEGCTHHRQCKDIGTVKMPGWIEEYTKAKPVYEFTSGGDFSEDLSDVALVVHCGGCMLNEAQMKSRVLAAKEAGVPMVNYGIAIAAMHGILKRSLEALPEMRALIE